MPILINNLQEKIAITQEQLSLAEKALLLGIELHNRASAEVSLVVVDNDYIQELNLEYRGKDQATDVLSFAMEEEAADESFPVPEEAPVLLGDIYISAERAQEQSAAYGHSFERELCYLAVHGLLHLLGFDHQTPDDTAIMRDEEEKVLAAFEIRRSDK